LLISYYFPPVNVVGALRWQKLSGALARRGWVLDVVMVEPDHATPLDPLRLNEVPTSTRRFGVPDVKSRLFRLQQSAWRLVRPIFRGSGDSQPQNHEQESGRPPQVPERESLARAYLARLMFREMFQWAERATALARRVARERPPHVVVSSGPPHAAHEVARRIAGERGIPFIMDLRDPWCSVENMPKECESRTWMRLAGNAERRCVEDAQLVVVTTEAARVTMVERYPGLAHRFVRVMNGADPEVIPTAERATRFVIAYAGNLYYGRDPRNLFRAVARVTRELGLSPDSLAVQFLGGESYEGRPVTELASEVGVQDFFVYTPPRPRVEALKTLAGASMLVSLPQYAHLAIPAKLFEYVQFDAWLLVLAERGSATELLFRGTDADVVEPDAVDAMAAVIRQRFEQFRRGERPVALNRDGAFNRDRQAELLVDALERLR
jgi:glycosyltransferase involved in cell wall biosynthesis